MSFESADAFTRERDSLAFLEVECNFCPVAQTSAWRLAVSWGYLTNQSL